MCRESSGPVISGQIVHITLGIIKLVGDLCTTIGILGISCQISVCILRLVRGYHGCIPCLCHAICGRLALCGQNIVDGFMCIFCCCDVICAGIQDIGLCAIGIICLKLFFIKGHGDSLRCARLQDRCLSICQQFYGRLLYSIFLVIIGIWTLCVKFYDIFSCHISGVFHINSHGALVTRPCCLHIRPVKGCVGKTITKWIDHFLCVIIISCISLI